MRRSRRWFAFVFVLAFGMVLACAPLQRGFENVGRVLPGAVEKVGENPSTGGLVNLGITLATAFVTGVAGVAGGKKMEKRRARKKGHVCKRCGGDGRIGDEAGRKQVC